ncbi:MAG: FlgD immunoglobulin-like domain containing protein [Chitinispirillaceae bacterium]
MSLSADVGSLRKASDSSYSISAPVSEGKVDSSGSKVDGKMEGELFKDAQKEMGKDDFLLLLTTQLKYQDPLNPMENTEFVSQLAQFRALESSNNIESAIGKLGESYGSSIDSQQYAAQSVANSSAVNLIGKTVRMRQPTVSWSGEGGEAVPLTVHLGENSEALVEIRNEDDEVIKTIEVDSKDALNSSTVLWDGTTDKGEPAKPGNYLVSIAGEEEDSSLYPYVQDKVAGVRFTPDGALVKIAGREISIGELLDVSQEDGSAEPIPQSSVLSLMGKHVRVRQDSVTFRNAAGERHEFKVQAQPNQQVSVQLKNSAGQVERVLSAQADAGGTATLSWNGENAGGSYVDPGTYSIHVAGSESNPGLYAYTEGVVDGLTSLTGDVKLKIGGRTVSFSEILDISTPVKEGVV